MFKQRINTASSIGEFCTWNDSNCSNASVHSSLDPERTAIHTNLVVALGIAQIVFLAGINATENKV